MERRIVNKILNTNLFIIIPINVSISEFKLANNTYLGGTGFLSEKEKMII